MTVSLMASYRCPEDSGAFDAHYRDVHIPLVLAIPGLQSLTVNRVTKHLMGDDRPYMIVVMAFADREAFDAAMASDENKAAGRDVMSFAKGLVSLMVSESETVHP